MTTDSGTSKNQPTAINFNVGSAICSWLIPGLGHIILGHVKRGFIVMVAIYSLFLFGLLIGGIDVVDPVHNKLWFAGQCGIGPVAPALGQLHMKLMDQNPTNKRLHPPLPPRNGVEPSYYKSIARVNELGMLYCAMAGMLNLLVIIDALTRAPVNTHPSIPKDDTGKLLTREGATS